VHKSSLKNAINLGVPDQLATGGDEECDAVGVYVVGGKCWQANPAVNSVLSWRTLVLLLHRDASRTVIVSIASERQKNVKKWQLLRQKIAVFFCEFVIKVKEQLR
jgi:hypothetical protein